MSCAGLWNRNQAAHEAAAVEADLRRAEGLFHQGEHGEAVALFKRRFDGIPEADKPLLLARIIRHEIDAGNQPEVDRWARTAAAGRHPVADHDEVAAAAVAAARQALEEELKRSQEAAAAKAEQRRREQEEAAARERTRYIPGIAAVDVHGNFTTKGFALETLFGTEADFWFCTKESSVSQSRVEVMGQGPTRIESIRASYLNFLHPEDQTDDHAREFLAYAATIPYAGAEPQRAKAWVAESLGRSATLVIGGVEFELFRNPEAPRFRMLRIAPASANPRPEPSEPADPSGEASTAPEAMTQPRPAREWTDSTGGFRVTATFAGYINGTVRLRKEDGDVIEVDFERLSEADREFIRSLRNR